MLPLCRAENIAVTPYSPLARGRLVRDREVTTFRSETDQGLNKYDITAVRDQIIVDRVKELAERHGVTRTQIALAWLLQKKPVTAPIIGATKISQLEDAVGALDVTLTADEIAWLEEPYVPHAIIGHA